LAKQFINNLKVIRKAVKHP